MKLVIEDEVGTRSVVPFAKDEIVVGRAADGVTFRMLDRDVSRRHARFVRASGGVFVEDLGSLTGTRVNGERVSGRRRLREGDLVEIGDYDLAVLPDAEGDAAGAPPPLPPGAKPAPASRPATAAAPASAAIRPPAAAPDAAQGSPVLRRVLLAGLVALLLGVAAGLAIGFALRSGVLGAASSAGP